MCPSGMAASRADFLSGDSASRPFDTWTQNTTIVFSVDILPSTTQMQELCDIPYCKCEETTSSDCSWKCGRYQPRSSSWKKKVFLVWGGGGGGLCCYITRKLKFSLIQKNYYEAPGKKRNSWECIADRPSGKVFRDEQCKEHGIQAHLYYILVVVME